MTGWRCQTLGRAAPSCRCAWRWGCRAPRRLRWRAATTPVDRPPVGRRRWGRPTAIDRGQELSRSKGCSACHGANGEGGLGPAWVGALGSTVTLDRRHAGRRRRGLPDPVHQGPQAQVVTGYAVAMPPQTLTDARGRRPGGLHHVPHAVGMRKLLATVAAVGVLAAAGCGGGDDHELVGLTRDPEPQVDGTALPDVADGGAAVHDQGAGGRAADRLLRLHQLPRRLPDDAERPQDRARRRRRRRRPGRHGDGHRRPGARHAGAGRLRAQLRARRPRPGHR